MRDLAAHDGAERDAAQHRAAAAARGLALHYRAERDAAQRRAAADVAHAALLSAATVQAAARVQRTERDAAGAAGRIRTLAADQEAARQALQTESRQLAPLLPVVTRLSLYPAETLFAAPTGPDDAVTGLIVLRGLSSELERRARAVRDQQAKLAALAGQLTAEQGHLLALQQHEAEQQAAIAARAQAAAATQRASVGAADQAARLAAEAAARAATLGDAVARIEAAERAAQARFQQQASAAEAARRPDTARAARQDAASLAVPAGPGLSPDAAGTAPVAGRLAQGFGQPTDSGTSTGVTYASEPLATVTAPCGGRVDFAGPFRSYGRMLILDCGHEYRFVLAGLDRLDVAVGQSLARGAPVGRMAGRSGGPGSPAGSEAGPPSLYVQLRHADATIDPTRFLRAGR